MVLILRLSGRGMRLDLRRAIFNSASSFAGGLGVRGAFELDASSTG